MSTRAQIACWTCRDRRVRCDGTMPTCQKCLRSSKVCQGYGKRLSWPKSGDKRRAVVGDSPLIITARNRKSGHLFINTTWHDMEIYRRVNQSIQYAPLTNNQLTMQGIPLSNSSQGDLVDHFHDSGYSVLATFDSNSSEIRDALMSIVLASNTASGHAMYHALLAFSSLHQSGPNEMASQFKISALHSMSLLALKVPLSSAEAAQLVAACMLLGAYDILEPSTSSGEWLWHIQGAMDIIRALNLREYSYHRGINVLLNWVDYHDALSRFAMGHWKHKALGQAVPNMRGDISENMQNLAVMKYRPALPSPNPTFAILNLLSEACDTMISPRYAEDGSGEYKAHLHRLSQRLEELHLEQDPSKYNNHQVLPVEIFQISTKIYLARASQTPWEASTDLEDLIDMAFAGPIRDCYCPHFFPLFIIACEARTDDRRTAILGLIERTARSGQVRSREWLRNMVQSIWVHQDLHADSDLLVDYVESMSAVISSSRTVPSFV